MKVELSMEEDENLPAQCHPTLQITEKKKSSKNK